MAPVIVEETSSSLVFTVRRREPVLVAPAKPTPHDYKALSDIDDQGELRFHVRLVQFYRGNASMKGKDPAQVIRSALSEALVFYYPLAGRLREGPDRKLWVDCTGEGALFIEADADVTLQQFDDRDSLQPPIPCFDQLLFDVPGSTDLLNSPLLLVQVTRLTCGGFVFAIAYNHTLMDGPGLSLFLEAMAELARGAQQPSILPVWKRHLLNSRYPPRITRTHREYDGDNHPAVYRQHDDMVVRSFFIGPAELSVIRQSVPFHLRSCSTFELLTALLWRCRTLGLRPDLEEEMRVLCIVNSRNRPNSPLPPGFYGNAISYPSAVAPAGKLCERELAFAVELVRKAKAEAAADMEYIQSVADLMVLRGRPKWTAGSYIVSDTTSSRLRDVDYGWGKAVYGGVGNVRVASFYTPFKKKHGVEGILVPICLPALAMKRFGEELHKFFNHKPRL